MQLILPLITAATLSYPLLSVAQSTTAWWSSLSPCVIQCAKSAAATAGCDVSDLKCLCKSSTFLVDFRNCVELSCPITTPAASPETVFSNACLKLDWTWNATPCIRNCASNAAQFVGCNLNDFICLCNHKAAFLTALFTCINNNCPAQLGAAENFVANNFVCPVVDPPPPNA